MATIAMTNELDVLNRYNSLVNESLGADSVYIRTKETLTQLFEENSMTNADKANIISSVLSALNTSVVQTSMQTALQWVSAEKELELKKLELEKQLDILDQDKAVKEAQADKLYYDSIAVQAESLRMNGNATVVDGKVVALNADGNRYKEAELVAAKTITESKQQNVLDAAKEKSWADTNRILADTYINHGAYKFVHDADGIASVQNNTGTHKTLSYYQAEVSKEQAKGYAYNAWANATSSLSSTIGAAIGAEFDIFSDDQGGVVAKWSSIVDQLSNVNPPSI